MILSRCSDILPALACNFPQGCALFTPFLYPQLCSNNCVWRTCMRRVQLSWFFLIVLFANAATAQVPDPATTAQAPIPGSGHSYIGIGAETVNPVNGMLSFDLPIKTPAGRGLSFPFGIRYNGGETSYLTTVPGGIAWQIAPAGVPNEIGGWSYELPAYAAQATVTSAYPDSSGRGTDYCDSASNYVFRLFDGIQYNPGSPGSPASIGNHFADGSDITPSECAPFGGNASGFLGNGAVFL